jgi:hypothetical protein
MVSNLTVKVGADIAGLQKELQKATGQLNVFGKGMGQIGKVIAGAFAVGQLIQFGKEVFNITAEFQKFEAVLTNTLGSNSAANAALAQITEFASKTPFQVNELTSAFVKLANQGFVPTMEEMTSLGDLAAAMGKSFDQLTEAIIDAQTGEFERLKEFGIRASKQGDKVTFTFKGVKKQVDFTADSIREYVLSLGDIKGVTGGMEAQSKTLGGTLSNLQDAFDQLKVSIGNLVEGDGVVSAFLTNLAAGAKAIADALAGPTREELIKTRDLLAQIREKAWAEKDMATWERARAAWQEADERLRAMVDGEEKLAEIQNTKTTPAVKAQTQSVRELITEWDRLHSIFKDKAFNPADQIGTKTGSDLLFDSGTLANFANLQAKIKEGLRAMGGELKINSNEFAIWSAQLSANLQAAADKIELDFAPIIHNALAGIGQALGSALSGSANLGDALLGVLGGVLTQLGGMILAAGIGVESFKESLKSLNGTVAIVAGLGLIALGAAISGSIRNLGGSAGGGGGVGSGRPGRLPSQQLDLQVGGRIRGYDLAIVEAKTRYRRSRAG